MTTSSKLRAVVLSAIMVLSVLAIGGVGTVGASNVHNGPTPATPVQNGQNNVTVMNLTFTSSDVRINGDDVEPGDPFLYMDRNWFWVDHDQDRCWDTGEETMAHNCTNDIKRDETLLNDTGPQLGWFDNSDTVYSEDLNDPHRFSAADWTIDIDNGGNVPTAMPNDGQLGPFFDYDGVEDLDGNDGTSGEIGRAHV